MVGISSSKAEETAPLEVLRAEAKSPRDAGHAARTCAELIKGLSATPLTAKTAVAIASSARRAGMESVANAALEDAWPQARAEEHLVLHRLLARLWRRAGRPDQARLHLYPILAERPSDRRAQLALTRVLGREGRTQELEKTLARLARDAAALGRPSLAARFELERGRILCEALGDRRTGAMAYQSASDHLRAAGRAEPRLWACAVSGAALAAGKPEKPQIEEAIARLQESGLAARREKETSSLARALRSGGTDPAPFLASMAAVAERRREKLLAVVLWEATIESDPGAVAWPAQLVRLFTGERAWFDLAEHYRRCASRPQVAQATAMRSTWLNHRAEILEARLGDLPAAAQARGEAFAVGGDRVALRAQLGLLERISGPQAAEISLDRTVVSAGEPATKAAALQVRAERHAHKRRFSMAVADLTRAQVLHPLDADGQRLLGECRAEEGEASAISELWAAAGALPQGSRDRAERFRRLAQLCLWPLGDAERSLRAWREVLANLPGDVEAEDRLLQAAQVRNQPEEIVPLLRGRISRLIRGPEARQTRHELARLLERLGRDDEAERAWEEAVRAEPSDASAQLSLADRLEARTRFDEAAMALEGAAQALDDPSASGQVWLRLGRLYREKLHAPDRAYSAEKRAVALGVIPELGERRKGLSDPRLAAAAAPRLGAATKSSPSHLLPASAPAAPTPPPSPITERIPLPAKEPTTASGSRGKRRRTQTHRLSLAKTAPQDLLAAFERNPLSPAVHRHLADHYERKGDVLRASLFNEVQHALEGDPDAHPLAPRGTLSGLALASLRHPELRGPAVEAMSIIGEVLCGQLAKTRRAEPFNMAVGKGAPAAGQALLDVVRLLGQRAPDVVLGAEEGPPFLLQNSEPVRLAVGKMAVRKQLPAAELRFFAARALYSLNPELLALRLLDAAQLDEGLQKARDALLPEHLPLLVAPSIKAMAAAIGAKKRERFVELMDTLEEQRVDWDRLIAVARYTGNRAGLLAAGGVAPTLRALQAKKAGKDELSEVVRFAVSDRMVRIRTARK